MAFSAVSGLVFMIGLTIVMRLLAWEIAPRRDQTWIS
jgi:hypothetical protein